MTNTITLPRSVLEQALEALDSGPLNTERFLALQALRQAIDAWQQSEPVASIYVTPAGEREIDDWRVDLPIGRNLLYANPQPAQQPLTEEQINALLLAWGRGDDGFHGFARAIEAMHGIGGEA